MKYEDLPAAARAQVDAKLGRKPRASKGGTGIGGRCPYRCVPCGETFDQFSGKGGAEEHARTSGHVRQEMILHESANR